MATGQYTQFPIDWQSLDATKVPYSNTVSGLTATDVQNAIDELNTDLNAIDASTIPYDNTTSGLTADDVQEAIDEIDGTLDSLGTEVGGLTDSFTVSLPLASWSSNSQTVSDAKFVASGYSYFVSASPSDTLDYGESVIYADNVTTDGSMVFHCVDLPVRDLTVNITKVAITA